MESPFKPTDGHQHMLENRGVTVTPAAVEAEIVAEHYFNAGECAIASGHPANASLELLTYCVLTLRNGFTVTGQSACADPRKYNREVGERVARGDAIRQVWPLMGYALREQLFQLTLAGDDLGEALTRMVAFRLGNPEAFRIQDAEVILKRFNGDSTENEAS